ncbi:MAG: protein kinase [Chloroflexota bacterium]|nr:protein kinase [Chloroflexota bacterium]
MVDRIVASLTVDERVGQVVMVNFVGDDVSATSDVAALIRDFHVGSVLLQASNGNIVNRDDTARQLADLSNGLQQRAYEATQRTDQGNQVFVPLLIATDNEGDLFPFTNVTNGFTAIPNNMTIGATWSKTNAEATGQIVGKELSAAGVNMLLGPVVDVLDTPRSGGNGDIGTRSFGGSAAWVGELGRAYIRGVHEGSTSRMLTVAKHFPGHGESDRSTDDQVPTVNKSLDQLRQTELAPFGEVARADAGDPLGTTDGMLVSHISYRNFVPNASAAFTRPVSFDRDALTTLLGLPEFADWRGGHLLMADSLGVPAVKKLYAQGGAAGFPNRTVVRDALLAGNDLLPFIEFYNDPDHAGWKNNQLPLVQDSILYLRKQYALDPDVRRRVDDAVHHVIAAKLKLYPTLQPSDVLVDPAKASTAAGQGDNAMLTLAQDALTLVEPSSDSELRARLPRGPESPEKVLIVECWADCYPYRVKAKADLENTLLGLYGPGGAGRLRPEDVSTISFGELASWLKARSDPGNAATGRAISDAAWIVFALSEYDPIDHPESGAVKQFLDTLPVDVQNKTLVGIAYNVPYNLDSTELSKLTAYFAVYNKTHAAIETSFRALYGDVTPKGHSPVDISGIYYFLSGAISPDPDQELNLTVSGHDPGAVPAGSALSLVAGPITDRNGDPVSDGTIVSFSIARGSAAPTTATAKTVDGSAVAELATSGTGTYIATASVGGITSKPLSLKLLPGAFSPQGGEGGSAVPLTLILLIAAPLVVALGGGTALATRYRRRRSPFGTRETSLESTRPYLAARRDRQTVAVDAPPKSFGGGRYVVKRVLGAGGQKTVYLVHDADLDRDCALSLIRTVLEPDDLRRLRREAQTMARLVHPNIVTIYDIEEEAGRPYIVCEYVAGGDLKDALRTADGPLPIDRARAIVEDITRGLIAAHARGVVHRDIKPANVWLDAGGKAKLGDFGLALTLDHSSLTLPGVVMGTVAYMSPEQALGRPADARSDLYSLGALLYELAAGRPPFVGDDAAVVIAQHVSAVPKPPSQINPAVPAKLEALIVQLLAKAPEERPDGALAVLSALQAVAPKRKGNARVERR